jgi:hypothetical protein
MKRKIVRNKAFLGAIVGGIASAIGSGISARKQRKAQEKAYKEAQAEQTKQEGFQQAASMSSTYANQDYVNQYRDKITLKNGGKVKTNDRIKVAKKFACGGRKKANFGDSIKNDFKSIKTEFNRDNLGNTIADITNGITGAISNGFSMSSGNKYNPAASVSTTTSIERNKQIAQDANDAKTQRGTYKCGGRRKKAMFGVGQAVGGVANMMSSIFTKTPQQKQVKTAVGFSYQTPKTGITQNSYQTDENGNPINAVNTNNAPQPQYQDRIQQAMRCGGRKRKKEGGIFERISTNVRKARERYGDRMAEGRRRNAEYQRQQNAKAAAKRKLVNDTNAAVEASKRAYRKARPNSVIYK